MSSAEEAIRHGCTHFDHHGKELRDHTFEIYERLRESDPVHYTQAWGGYWVLTRYADVARVARDDATFSSGVDGILMPVMNETTYPISMDPPESTRIKRLLTPYFSPQALQDQIPEIRRLATELINGFIEAGRCEFVYDLGLPLTGIITMQMAGLDTARYREFADMIHQIVYAEGTLEELMCLSADMVNRIAEEIAAQKVRPRSTGIIADLLRLQATGEDVSDEIIAGIVQLLFAGGLDTTQANLGHTLVQFQRQPHLRKVFVERPDLRMSIVEESLRLLSPTQALFRTVMADTEIGGKLLKKGDRVMLCWGAANRDPEKFECPKDFIPDRKPNLHMAFGVGSHRCLGSSLARYEIMIQLEEILLRMPDYKIDETQIELPNSVGTVYGYRKVPMTFSPGVKVAVPELAA